MSSLQAKVIALSTELVSLRALPVAPSTFSIAESGQLVAIYPDGTTKDIGRVRGEDGKRGASMMDAALDDDGLMTIRMSDARNITVKGRVRGDPGQPGRDGKDGLMGRDAVELVVRDGIDDLKSYPSGTCARYRGGVIRAERQTDPVENDDVVRAGWRVVLEGIAEETEQTLDDGRVVERTTVYTGGRVFTRRRTVPSLIYRGVWETGFYQRGDCVTRQGALWHCERDTSSTPGTKESLEDWKLAVKSGRDGKEGPPGRNGKDGHPGTPGRDGARIR